jgi:hypothetical protein
MKGIAYQNTLIIRATPGPLIKLWTTTQIKSRGHEFKGYTPPLVRTDL